LKNTDKFKTSDFPAFSFLPPSLTSLFPLLRIFDMAVPSSTTIRNLNTANKGLSFRPNDNKTDQLLRKIQFQPLERSTDQFSYQQATSLPTVTFFAQGASVNNNVAVVSTTTLTLRAPWATCCYRSS
jgi:hypothetical protein